MAQALGEKVQPQELVLTLLGAHLQPRTRPVWSGGLVSVLGEFGISPGAARVTLTRLLARGMLDRTKAGRLVHYTITPRTAAILSEGDARIFSFGQAADTDPTWTVVWHTIPDDRRHDRSRLTRRLRFLGFGPVQDGAWLAPRDHEHEVARLVAELGLHDHTAVLIGRPSTELDPRRLAERVWDLDGLAARYEAFVDEYRPVARQSVSSQVTPSQALRLRTTLVHHFREFPALDPELPPDIAPAPTHRARAIELFHAVYAALEPAAQKHFDEATTP